MNIRDLDYLVAVYHHKSFCKAAAACFVSQPALSMQIKKLEANLAVKLIERHAKQLIFTQAGEAIVKQAKLILLQVNNLRDLAKHSHGEFSGALQLGVIPTLAPYLLPKIIKPLNKSFPKIQFYLYEEKTDVLIKKLNEGILDAALMALPIKQDNLAAHTLFNEDFLLATPSSMNILPQDKVSLADLSKFPLMLLAEGHCLREQIVNICAQVGVTNMPFQATSLETLRQMVVAKTGCTLMPRLACLPQAGIKYIEFTHPAPQRSLGLVFRKSSAKMALINALSEKIKNRML